MVPADYRHQPILVIGLYSKTRREDGLRLMAGFRYPFT